MSVTFLVTPIDLVIFTMVTFGLLFVILIYLLYLCRQLSLECFNA